MKLMLQGDYYVWYCDWCDSRNHTLWTRVDKDKVTCGVCYTPFSITPQPVEETNAVMNLHDFKDAVTRL